MTNPKYILTIAVVAIMAAIIIMGLASAFSSTIPSSETAITTNDSRLYAGYSGVSSSGALAVEHSEHSGIAARFISLGTLATTGGGIWSSVLIVALIGVVAIAIIGILLVEIMQQGGGVM